MMTLFSILSYPQIHLKEIETIMQRKLDEMLVKYDAWFIVLLALLLTVAFTLTAAMAVWCVVKQGKKFTGNWKWWLRGISLSIECK